MNKRCRVLRAPDPRLLSELVPEDFFLKITQQGLCFVVDDDGTVSASNEMYMKWLARELRRPLRIEDYTRYDFSNIDRSALGMLKAGVFGNPRLHRHLPVIPGSVEALREIHGKKIAIVILTARPPQHGMVRATYDHKVDHKIPFDLMIFSPRKKEIVKAIRKLGGCRVIMVDDNPEVIASISSLADVTAIIFDARYNRRLCRKNVIRAKPKGKKTAWDEVLKVVRKMNGNGRR